MKGKQLALIISHAERRFLKGSYKTLANAAASLYHGKKGFPQYIHNQVVFVSDLQEIDILLTYKLYLSYPCRSSLSLPRPDC